MPAKAGYSAGSPQRVFRVMTTKYSEQYKHPLWLAKRDEMFKKRGRECQKCSETEKAIQLHHLYYVAGRKLWEYQDWAFQILCKDCHESLHKRKQDPLWEVIVGCLIEEGTWEHGTLLDCAIHFENWPISWKMKIAKLEKFLYWEKFCEINNYESKFRFEPGFQIKVKDIDDILTDEEPGEDVDEEDTGNTYP